MFNTVSLNKRFHGISFSNEELSYYFDRAFEYLDKHIAETERNEVLGTD